MGDARVCLWKEDEIYEVDVTAPNGEADFAIAPADSGEMLVTVVKEGYLPYPGSAMVGDDVSGIIADGEISGRLETRIVPNPAVGSANIRCSIPKGMSVRSGDVPTVRIFDAAGRLVKAIVFDREADMVTWDGKLADGVSAPPGVYFSKLTYGNVAATTKFVLLR